MNKLFPIPLRGAGTCDVESLASYVHRLAFEHGLFVGELIRYIYRNAVPYVEDASSLPELPRYLKVEEFVRPNRTTKMYVRFIEMMSSQPLRESTLWFMDCALGRSSGEVVQGFRWCPECFKEMEDLGQEPYFKLIWHLSGINACQRHRTPLSTLCEFCGCNQIAYRKHYPLFRCQRCGERLAERARPLTPSDIRCTWESEGGDLLQLLRDLAASHSSELPEDGVMRSLDQLFEYYWSQDREDELYRLITRDQFLALIHRQTPISLKVARRIAYRLGLSLYTLMSGNARYSSAVLNSSWVCELPPSFMERAEQSRRDHEKVIRKLQDIIVSASRPPSLKLLADELGVSVGYLEYRFPAVVKEVVARHQKFVGEEKRKRQLAAQNAALRFFKAGEYTDCSKSRRQAYKVLRDETSLPKFLLKRAIQSAYEVMC